MGGAFGKSKSKSQTKSNKAQTQAVITEQDRAILELKRQQAKLHQYQTRMTEVIKREREFAKQALMEGDKPKALRLIRRAKYQESLLSKTDEQMLNLEKMVTSIEFASISKSVFDALATGNKALEDINATCSLEMVDELMQSSAESIEHQRKIDELLMGGLGQAQQIDEQDLQRELNDMMQLQEQEEQGQQQQQQQQQQATGVGVDVDYAASMPSVPTTKKTINNNNTNLTTEHTQTVVRSDQRSVVLS